MPPKIAPWAFVLAVPDLDGSAGYFRDVVMLGHCPDDTRPADLGSHSWFGYLEVDNIDALYDEIVARGATCSQPADRHYGMREVVVTTVDGHRIVFGQEVRDSSV